MARPEYGCNDCLAAVLSGLLDERLGVGPAAEGASPSGNDCGASLSAVLTALSHECLGAKLDAVEKPPCINMCHGRDDLLLW